MRKQLIIYLTVLLSFSSVGNAQEINWVTFEEAVELTKENPKKLLIDLYTDWCGWCKRMDKTTYENPEVIKAINKNFYPVRFNAEQKDPVSFDGHTFKFVVSGRRGYHELAAALTNNKLSYPTTVFMDEEIRIIQPIPGYMGPADFLPILTYIGEGHFKKTSWEEYTSTNN